MAEYIAQDILEEIRSRTDIVAVISEYIPLKKSGANYKALCPFHNEKTPSFMVSPAKQIYHCFGCGEGGNVFNFVMKYEHLDFSEAAGKIAEKAGVNIPRQFGADKKMQSLFNQLYKINEAAADFFSGHLNESLDASHSRDYLKERGFTQKTLLDFKLGYAPNNWTALYDYLRHKDFSVEMIEKAGLISPKGGGGYCDRFRNRVMFPIFNLYDKVIGFGARALEEKQIPKYLNSSDTPVFNKGKNLYGLNLAKREIISKDRAIIVEGYTDCIRCHENGFKEAVAPLGTALTEWQIRALKRYTKNVILIFDADQAGETASLRGLDLLISEGIIPKIAVMPAGFDPDKYLLEKGAEEYEKIVKNAPDFFDYKVNLLRLKYKAQDPEGKAGIAAELLPTLARVDNAVLKSAYVRKLADVLEVAGTDILSELKKIKNVNYSYDKNEIKKISQDSRVDMAEKILFVLMLEDNNLIKEVRNALRPVDFESDGMRKIVELIFDFAEKGKEICPSRLIDAMGGNEAARLISSISVDTPEITDAAKNLNDCIRTIKRRNIDKKIKELKAAQRKAQGEKISERTFKLTVEFAQLVNERKKFARSVK